MIDTIAALTSIDWSAIWAAVTTITTALAGVVAAIQNRLKNKAEAETAATQAFFDPDNNEAMTPTASTPDRSWKMSAATKASILDGKSYADQLSITEQIQNAENAGYVDYKIVWSDGFYDITYGLIESAYHKTSVSNSAFSHYSDGRGNIVVGYTGKAVESNAHGDTDFGNAMEIFEDAIAAGKIKLDGETEYYVNKDDAWYFTARKDGSYQFHSPWYPEKAIPLLTL